MCCAWQNREMNIINNAAWKKKDEIKKDVNKGRKVIRKRYRKLSREGKGMKEIDKIKKKLRK